MLILFQNLDKQFCFIEVFAVLHITGNVHDLQCAKFEYSINAWVGGCLLGVYEEMYMDGVGPEKTED